MARPRPLRLFTLMDVAVEGGRAEDFGARAIALVDARRRGAPVADAWVLPASAFRDVVAAELPPGHDPASLLRAIHKPLGLERAARARERLLDAKLPEGIAERLASIGSEELVVRASPTLADDTVADAAGLRSIVFGVRGLDAISRAIREVWAGAVLEDSLRYLRERRVRDFAVAIVLQRAEPAEACGVLFTREPGWASAGPTGVSLIGVGQALSLHHPQTASALDVLRLSGEGLVLGRRVAVKQARAVAGSSGLEIVPEESADPALPESAAPALALVATQLDVGGPREVEFSWSEESGVRVLDAQKLTGSGFPRGGDAHTVWSRSGLGELLPGVPTPLTASLAEAFCEAGLRQAFASLGVKVQKGTHLVERVSGRFYFNLSALVPATGGVPGIDPATLLDLVRGADPQHLGRALELVPRRALLARLPLTVARLAGLERRLADDVARFEREADGHRRWLVELDLGILPDDSLKTTLLESHRFFVTTGRLMLSCTLAALAAHVGLKTVLARSLSGRAEQLAQAVTAGVGDLESAAPGVALSHVAGIVDKDAAARAALLSGPVADLAELPAGPARRAIQQFLDAYGDRAIREAELSTPRWAEQPETVLALLSSLLHGEPIDPERRLSSVRVRADRELALIEATVPFIDRMLVTALIRRARELTRLREKMRVWMARTLAMMRQVTLDVDRRLRRLDSTLRAGAAFYLTFGELVSAAGNVRADLAPVVRTRRASFARDTARPDPPETFVGIPPRFALPPVDGVVALRGAACSPGIASGPARRVGRHGEGAENVRPGDVLVLRSPDSGLSPLFLRAAAVVTELGGSLSHGAVIAREYGVPAVTGVTGVLATVREGELLRVDGDRGLVERVGQ